KGNDEMMGDGMQGEPAAKGAGEKKEGSAPGQSKGSDKGTSKGPGDGVSGDRTGMAQDTGDPQAARKEKPGKHRASALQLEQFRKKVNQDVLKDAKMSKEQFEQFLKDYADLAKRQEAGPEERDTPPAPGRTGTLPSMASKPIKPTGKTSDDVKSEGR